MKFDVLTLFPEMFEPLKQSIIKRASENNLININLSIKQLLVQLEYHLLPRKFLDTY